MLWQRPWRKQASSSCPWFKLPASQTSSTPIKLVHHGGRSAPLCFGFNCCCFGWPDVAVVVVAFLIAIVVKFTVPRADKGSCYEMKYLGDITLLNDPINFDNLIKIYDLWWTEDISDPTNCADRYESTPIDDVSESVVLYVLPTRLRGCNRAPMPQPDMFWNW